MKSKVSMMSQSWIWHGDRQAHMGKQEQDGKFIVGLCGTVSCVVDSERSMSVMSWKRRDDLHSTSESELSTRHARSSSQSSMLMISVGLVVFPWSNRLHEFLGFLNNGIELGVCEWVHWHGITMGSLTPSHVAETSLAHGVFAGGEIESLREGYHLAFASMGHCNGQCPSGNQS